MNRSIPTAMIGVAQCPHTHKLYGVRIEVEGKKWTATWAFPISPEAAKREGYTQNVFPPDLIYHAEYPGCPYCRRHEDLAAISKPKPVKRDLRISVTQVGCDDIGKVLSSLKIPHTPYQTMGLRCDMLCLNCLTPDHVDPTALRNWVHEGGCLYASDLTESTIRMAFPGLFHFRGNSGQTCRITADVVDTELREYVGATVPIVFDLPSWAILESCEGDVLLRASRGNMYAGLPIMVRVRYGKGTIFYTCFHNHRQASAKETAFLQLAVLRQLGATTNASIAETGASYGVDLEKLKRTFRSNW